MDHYGYGRAQVRGQAGVVPEEVAEARVQQPGEEVPQGEVSVEEEAEKVGESLQRDTVGGPGTVVVHLGDAGLAVFAVVGAKGLRGGAFLAPAGCCRDRHRNDGMLGRGRGDGGGGGGGLFRIVDMIAAGLLVLRRGKDVSARWNDAGFVVCPPHAGKEDVEDGCLTLGKRARLEVFCCIEEPLGGVAQEEDQDADSWNKVGLQLVGRWAGQDARHGGLVVAHERRKV